MPKAPPKDGSREWACEAELRDAQDGGMPRLTGYMLRFNEWTTINSAVEGRFRERVSPSAIRKTLQEHRDKIKILYNHGHDPLFGERPIAPPKLIEDERGLRYDEPALIDSKLVRDELVPILREGALGSSFRFHVVKEDWEDEPQRSDENPDGLPERTIQEMRIFEGGPVTFPAYEGATAGARSLTDKFVTEEVLSDPERFAQLDPLFKRWAEENAEELRKLLGVTEGTAFEADLAADGTEEKTEVSDTDPDAGPKTDSPESGRSEDNDKDRATKHSKEPSHAHSRGSRAIDQRLSQKSSGRALDQRLSDHKE